MQAFSTHTWEIIRKWLRWFALAFLSQFLVPLGVTVLFQHSIEWRFIGGACKGAAYGTYRLMHDYAIVRANPEVFGCLVLVISASVFATLVTYRRQWLGRCIFGLSLFFILNLIPVVVGIAAWIGLSQGG